MGQNSVNFALYNFHNTKQYNYHIDEQNLLISFQNNISYTLIIKLHLIPDEKFHKKAAY